jgi:hypothetical protein
VPPLGLRGASGKEGKGGLHRGHEKKRKLAMRPAKPSSNGTRLVLAGTPTNSKDGLDSGNDELLIWWII